MNEKEKFTKELEDQYFDLVWYARSDKNNPSTNLSTLHREIEQKYVKEIMVIVF